MSAKEDSACYVVSSGIIYELQPNSLKYKQNIGYETIWIVTNNFHLMTKGAVLLLNKLSIYQYFLYPLIPIQGFRVARAYPAVVRQRLNFLSCKYLTTRCYKGKHRKYSYPCLKSHTFLQISKVIALFIQFTVGNFSLLLYR